MAIVMRGRGWIERDQVAREIGEQQLYRRGKDGLPPPSYQIGMRARRYSHWFEARGPGGSQIRLVPGGPGASDDNLASAMAPSMKRTTGSAERERTEHESVAAGGDAHARNARERRAQAAAKYRPTRISTLLIAEAPSAAKRYFYFEDVRTDDSLFREVAWAFLGETPGRDRKDLALASLRDAGVFLIDLCEDPVDDTPLSAHVQVLVRRVQNLAPDRVILIKVTVYDAAYAALLEAGLPVVDERIPFPGSGRQLLFREAFPRAMSKAR
jgi:hypothetical protein